MYTRLFLLIFNSKTEIEAVSKRRCPRLPEKLPNALAGFWGHKTGKAKAVVYTGFPRCAGLPEAMWRVLFYIGEIKNFASFKLENFHNVKKSMKNC